MRESVKVMALGVLTVGVIGLIDVGPPAEAGAQSAESTVPSTPQAQPDSYRLIQIAGRALPTIVEEEDGCREELVGATLTLANPSWTLLTSEREVCGEVVETEEEHETGSYTLSAQTIQFRDDDDDNDDDAGEDDEDELDVDELHLGTVSTDGSLTVQLRDGQTLLVFRR